MFFLINHCVVCKNHVNVVCRSITMKPIREERLTIGFNLSPFTLALSIHCRMEPSINVFHCRLSVAFLFHLSPRLCPSTAGCSSPSMSSIVVCLLLSCFTFHLGFVHPLQDVALHQCLPLSSVCCFPVSPFT